MTSRPAISDTIEPPVDGDASLVAAVLARDQNAWRALMKHYDRPLRDVVRSATEGLTGAQIDDVLGDFWLRLVEHNMRRLRAYDPQRGPSLISLLTFHVSQIAHEHVTRLAAEPPWVALDEATRIPDLRAAPVARLKREARMLRVEEIARRWDLNVKTVYGMIERGELSARRFGRVLRVPRTVVESFESQASVGPGGKKPCR